MDHTLPDPLEYRVDVEAVFLEARGVKVTEHLRAIRDWLCTITGLSIYFNIGSWGGIGIEGNSRIARLVLGWVSIGVMAADLEKVIGEAAEVMSERELR